jgi:Concanavalin A-like lectin/glucanases superfamily
MTGERFGVFAHTAPVRFGGLLVLVGACKFGTSTSVNPDGDPVDDLTDMQVVIADAPPGAWLAGFTYRKGVVVTRPGTQALQDFPVGIVFGSDADLAAHARPDGRDIVVTTGDAMTRLDSELVAFSNTGALELWARVPTLPAGATTLFVYYGGAATTTNPATVFPTARFKGVWHLSDANPAAAADSTPANHTLASAGAAVPASISGVAGSARSHDGIDDALAIPDPVDGSLDVGTTSFSYSTWIKSTATVDDFDNPFFKGGTSTSNPGYCIMTGNYNPWIGKLHDGTSFVEVNLSPTTTLGAWLHLVVVVDRSVSPAKGRGYVNGAMVSQIDVTLGSLSTNRGLSLGAGSGGSLYHGLIDETRIYASALTADWIATEYANLTASGFLGRGPQETQ